MTKGPFIFYEGGGAGGIREAPFKNCMTPPQLANFFHMPPPPLEVVIFLVDPPPPQKKKIYIYINKITLFQDFTFFNTLCYSLIDVIAMKTIFTISNTTKSSSSDSTNQKKEKSISDLLVISSP